MIGKKIDNVRNEIIGLKVIDVESEGRVIHLEDEEGRYYSIDFTGKDGAIVYKGTTDKEDLENLQVVFNLLLEKLDIDESDLWDLYK